MRNERPSKLPSLQKVDRNTSAQKYSPKVWFKKFEEKTHPLSIFYSTHRIKLCVSESNKIKQTALDDGPTLKLSLAFLSTETTLWPIR